MAIYYVSPYTVTNGTGTWASPYSTSLSTRVSLVVGDEVRVVAKPLTTLLSPTTYTATFTDYRTLTITAGGGLGADFVVGDVCYLPAWDTFFKVTAVATNVINVGGSTCLPIYNSTAGSVTIQRVATGQLTATVTTQYIWSGLVSNNIAMTDGWVADGVRVTDGSAKSIVSTTGSALSLRLDHTTTTVVARTGVTIDLAQTHVMPGTSTSGAATVAVMSGGATTTIGQIFTQSGANVPLNTGGSASPCIGSTITVRDMSGYLTLVGVYAKSSTINLTRVSTRYGDAILYANSGAVPLYIADCTINIGDVVSGGPLSGTGLLYGNSLGPNTINITGTIDCHGTITNTFVTTIAGSYTLNLTPVAIYNNRRLAQVTSYSYKYYGGVLSLDSSPLRSVPTVNVSGLTISVGDVSFSGGPIFNATVITESVLYKQPAITRIDSPYPVTVLSRYPYSSTLAHNVLLTFRDGSIPPVEVLGIDSSPYTASVPPSNAPIVYQDASMFRTAGPSLRSILAGRVVAYWPSHARAIKNIKIPVTGGLSYTVSGYVRSSITGYTTGDCRMSIIMANAEVVGQDMTSAGFNAWEQFSLTFTAAFTGEAILAWEMYYRLAGNIWLDDLTIS